MRCSDLFKGTDCVLDDVKAERRRQDEKWGVQNHAGPVWALIMGEEIGEYNEALLEILFNDEQPEGMTFDEFKIAQVAHLRDEIIQACAVGVAWVEAILVAASEVVTTIRPYRASRMIGHAALVQ